MRAKSATVAPVARPNRLALAGAKATRDARDASESLAFVPRYQTFESISLGEQPFLRGYLLIEGSNTLPMKVQDGEIRDAQSDDPHQSDRLWCTSNRPCVRYGTIYESCTEAESSRLGG